MSPATGSDAHVYWNGEYIGSFTSIAQSTDNPILDVTSLGMSDRAYTSSNLRNNTFSGNLFYDPSDTAATALIRTIDEASAKGTLKIEWLKSSGIAMQEGIAIVTQRSASVSVGDLLQISISIQFSGAVAGGF